MQKQLVSLVFFRSPHTSRAGRSAGQLQHSTWARYSFCLNQALPPQELVKMCDMGGLDNLIANTAYLQARKSGDGDTKEMQKRRKSLSLPRIDQCSEVRQSIVADYDSICEQQPIGKKIFRDFLETVSEYLVARDFLDEVSNWELAEDNVKSSTMENMITNFLKAGSKNYLAFMSSDLASKCQAATAKDYENIMQLAKEETKLFLKGKPFQDFQTSPFYDKFLQWKVFEKQPVTEKYFYEFRVLGKGGFGEVRAVVLRMWVIPFQDQQVGLQRETWQWIKKLSKVLQNFLLQVVHLPEIRLCLLSVLWYRLQMPVSQELL